MRRKTTRSQLRRYFQEWLDTAFQNNLIDRHERADTLSYMEEHLPGAVESLNAGGEAVVKSRPPKSHQAGKRQPALKVFLREGLDPKIGKFNLFEIQWPRKHKPGKLRCFLGHRFVKKISYPLRMNLRYVLEPSNIDLVWSGMDMLAVGFFDDIIEKIDSCDFCIFDNRLASEKPNVYIEAGIAYALRKPFILADFQGNRLGIPSDLVHIMSIRYKTYDDMCRTLYANLPVFLKGAGLR